ncbi:peptidase S10, serine carboxypeptidase, alpha/beta hydrolase fold protein [Tanacetum coccineum]|uniref:Peptidase S10, serine carboxypeptidase, alpha/beta hydrolase fold protein n=1 Tax=Tanacetum coccineum TaxID=301880 RepID=A0ABQ5IIH5_9ASTR
MLCLRVLMQYLHVLQQQDHYLCAIKMLDIKSIADDKFKESLLKRYCGAAIAAKPLLIALVIRVHCLILHSKFQNLLKVIEELFNQLSSYLYFIETRSYGTFATSKCDGFVNVSDVNNKKILYEYLIWPLKVQPDKTSQDPKVVHNFQVTGEAYRVLSDPDKHEAYEKNGKAGVQELSPLILGISIMGRMEICITYSLSRTLDISFLVFGHIHAECPNNTDSDMMKNMKKPDQAPRGVLVGPKVGFKPVKQVFRQVSKKNNVNTSGDKKKDADAEPTIEVSNSNPFYVLNSIENDVDLGTNGETSNLASNKANSGGSSSWNVEASSTNTTPNVDKIDKYEKLIIDGKVSLVDDEGKPLKKVAYPDDHDSEDEVESVDNDMTHFMASERVGFGTNSLLEQWRDTYENVDYDYDPYDDDMHV